MAREHTTEELHAKLFGGDERFHLVDVLPHDSYVNRHIPGAIGIPLEDLDERAEELLPDRDVEGDHLLLQPALNPLHGGGPPPRAEGIPTLGHFSGGIRGWRGANHTFDIGHQRSIRPELRGREQAAAFGP